MRIFAFSYVPSLMFAKLKLMTGIVPCSFWYFIQVFKQVAAACIVNRKELLHHAHVERLSKAARAGNQRYAVAVFPPFFDEIGFST